MKCYRCEFVFVLMVVFFNTVGIVDISDVLAQSIFWIGRYCVHPSIVVIASVVDV